MSTNFTRADFAPNYIAKPTPSRGLGIWIAIAALTILLLAAAGASLNGRGDVGTDDVFVQGP